MPELKDKFEGHGSPVNLAICVPSMDTWLADFALSVISMHQLLHYHPLSSDFKHNLINERGSLITYQRENMADRAIASEATHILWLDSDMKFPPNLIHRLFKHDLPMVACNYVKRIIPAMPNSKDMNGKLIATNRDSHGLVEAESAGFGAVLMKTQVLKEMPKPWFDLVWLDKKAEDGRQELMGEDVFFFRKMRHFTDHKLFIDHDASQHVSHIGTFEYSNALAEATWDEIDMEETKAEMMG
jgi:hypothetical protein